MRILTALFLLVLGMAGCTNLHTLSSAELPEGRVSEELAATDEQFRRIERIVLESGEVFKPRSKESTLECTFDQCRTTDYRQIATMHLSYPSRVTISENGTVHHFPREDILSMQAHYSANLTGSDVTQMVAATGSVAALALVLGISYFAWVFSTW